MYYKSGVYTHTTGDELGGHCIVLYVTFLVCSLTFSGLVGELPATELIIGSVRNFETAKAHSYQRLTAGVTLGVSKASSGLREVPMRHVLFFFKILTILVWNRELCFLHYAFSLVVPIIKTFFCF